MCKCCPSIVSYEVPEADADLRAIGSRVERLPESTPCKGHRKSNGRPCRLYAAPGKLYCFLHDPDNANRPKCEGGPEHRPPCRNLTRPGSRYCGLHEPRREDEWVSYRCPAKTAGGGPCTQLVMGGHRLCATHYYAELRAERAERDEHLDRVRREAEESALRDLGFKRREDGVVVPIEQS